MLLVGVDAAVPGRWRRLVEAGLLPVGRRLLDEGRLARALPAMPTLTTTNWATIATGAWPGTHGVTDFNPYRLGDLPEDCPQGFDAREVRAEFLWEAVARNGRPSVVVNWPGSWPPRRGRSGTAAEGGVVLVGGAGIELNEWRIGVPGRGQLVSLAAEQRFSTSEEKGATRVALPPGGDPFELPFSYEAARDAVRPGLALVCRVARRADQPVVSIALPGASELLAELAVGEWSERIVLPFEVGGRSVPGAFRLKLLALDPAADRFRLYVTDICRLSWLERPAGVLKDPLRCAGLSTPGVGWASFAAGLLDLDTFLELTAMTTRWLADVCATLLAERPCDLLCTHFHAVDSFYHLCVQWLGGAQAVDPAVRRRFELAEQTVYREVDAAIGQLLEAAGGEVLTVLVSDHGVVPPGVPLPLSSILREAGLLTVAEGSGASGPGEDIDWSRTLAFPQGTCFVRLNLSGREPRGVVEPAQAEADRGRVIRALADYRDPASGLCPFALIAAKDDAIALGLRGDGVGDVLYAVRTEFSDVHGSMLPDATVADGDWGMPAMCLFSGAGAARGADLSGVSLVDVAPTVCRALGVGPPADADGVVRAGLLAPELATSTGT